jgi:dTDP-4-amino-4,6-dideoxygalactose transaminase
MDPGGIEELITPNTEAIVPVHVFGNGCEVEAIAAIAKAHGLKVVYDGAHAFDVKYKGESILNYGDISTLSFHATKLFHTIEGGALIINDDALVQKARYLINFGIENTISIPELGTNAKMNEFEAAMGLCMLDEIEAIAQNRKVVYERYEKALEGTVQLQEHNADASQNSSYFPIILDDEAQTLRVERALNAQQIFPRRYFYPSLDTLTYIEPKQHMPKARNIASRILCLPIHSDLPQSDQETIIAIIKKTVEGR